MQKTILIFTLAAVAAFGQGRGASGGRGGFGFGAPAIKSPEVSTDGKVTVRLRAPNAKEVSVTGLSSGQGARLALEKNDQGVWTGTSDTLKPDVYMYQFQVDGTTINDPSNPHLATSFGTGGRSVVTVEGADAVDRQPFPHPSSIRISELSLRK